MRAQDKAIRWTRAVLAVAAITLVGPAIAADDARAHLSRAQELFRAEEVKAAVIELKNALQKDPSLAAARLLLGEVYLRVGDGSAAEKELRRARALDGDSPQLILDLAEAYLLQHRMDEALKLLQPGPEGSSGVRVRTLTLRGTVLVSSGRIEEGRASFEEALALDPDAAKAILGLAQLELQSGDTAAAERHLDTLLVKHPDDMAALLLKAELLRRRGNLDGALALYDRAVKVNGKDVRPLLGRAVVRLIRRQLPEARADLDQVETLHKDLVMVDYLQGLLAFMAQDLEKAHAVLQSVLGRVPQHAPSQLLFGLVSYQRGEFETAEEYLGRFLVTHPDNPSAIKSLAAARLKTREAKGAIELLEPLVSPQTEDVQLLTLLGSAYLMDGRNASGTELLQRAVELSPDAASLRTQLALGLLAEGQTGAATEQLRAAVDLGQDVVQADVLLVLSHLRAHQYDRALKAGQEMEVRMPRNPVAYNLTGLAYLARNERDKARERFTKALELDPTFVTAALNLARIDIAAEDYDAADAHYRQALKIEPSNQSALVGLAATAERRGDTEAMVGYLEQAVEKSTDSPQAAILLTRHYLKAGDGLKALATIKRVQEWAPDNPAVIGLLGQAQATAGELNSAARSFQRLAEMVPTEKNYLLLARTRMATKDLAGARRASEEALRLAPESLEARLMLAAVGLEDNRPNDALLIALELQEKHPDRADGFRLEGLVRIKLGDPAQAASAFAQAYHIQKSADVARRLAAVYEKGGKTEQAAAILRDWLQESPEDMPSRMMLAMLLQKTDDRPGAIEQYEAIQARQTGNTVVQNNLAWLYFEKHDPRALKLAEEAYAADSKRPEVVDTYGWILLHSGGDANKALRVLQEAYVSLPTNAEIGYHVAVALHRVGRDTEATRTLRNVLAGGSRFPKLDEAKALLEELEK